MNKNICCDESHGFFIEKNIIYEIMNVYTKYCIIILIERVIFMNATVKQLLRDNHLTLRNISEQSSISETTLSSTFSRPVDSWSVRILKALANALNLRIDELDEKLSAKPFTLDVDEEKHMIQGVKIPDDLFFSIYSSVNFNVMEGWQPSAHDIENLVKQMQQSDVVLDKEIDKLWTK